MWTDVFKGMLRYFPLKLADGQQPIALTPTGSLVNGTTNTAWPIVLGAGASGSYNMLIPNDCDLEIDQWVASTTSAGYPNTLGFVFSAYYGNRQFQLNQAPVPGELVFGTAQRPGRWSDRPWRIASANWRGGQANLAFEITNTTASTLTIYFALMGWRSPPRAAATQSLDPQALGRTQMQQYAAQTLAAQGDGM